MDYSKLRATALSSGQDEEAVTVDTRALIDKVLARYSGEWTTLRELIQNAADASAESVSIKWETIPSIQVPLPQTPTRSDLLKHTISYHTLRRLVVQNDGQPFNEMDWNRLKRIAEGNPDETKIGAFGVGFYSVFADCEEPFVSSGSQAMAFYWKGNSLFTRKSQLPPEQTTNNTVFVLDYRNATTPLPNLLSLDFWIDDHCILSLTKKASPSTALAFPKDLETRTQGGLVNINGVARTSTQIDASYMSVSLFARLTLSASSGASRLKSQIETSNSQTNKDTQDATKLNSASIFLRVTSADITTNIVPSFAAELQRATKKPPPKTTKLSILTTSFDEEQASEASNNTATSNQDADIFASVLPSKKPGGRIFIGFPTMQTTGAGMHTWNMELLRATGIVLRLAFANEMQDLGQRVRFGIEPGKRIPGSVITKYLPEALHISKTFAFTDSTPSSNVGKIIEEAFWLCYKKLTLEVYSTQGVLTSDNVRIGSDELSSFLDTIPVIPTAMEQSAIVRKLMDFGLVSHVAVSDISQELQSKALTKAQAINFLKWLGRRSLNGDLDAGSRNALLSVAITTTGDDSNQGQVIALQTILNFQNAGKVPPHLPIPPTTIPLALTASCPVPELEALGWEPLGIVPWLSFLLETTDSRPESESITKSPKFAIQILTILSKNWDLINNKDRENIVSLVKDRTIVPTRLGMKLPNEAFFTTVKLFDDLPIITGCEKVKDKFLAALGVRRTVDLDTIFNRLLNKSGDKKEKAWSHVELIKYLASVQKDIPLDDINKLKESRICLAEANTKGSEVKNGAQTLYKVSELFEPKDTLRTLNLPILQWPGFPATLRTNSPERIFLSLLGLRTHPSVPELVDLMASDNENLRTSAMAFFIANHHTNHYADFDLASTSKAILPLKNGSQLVTPSSCFINERAAALGFNILKKELHAHAIKFGVAYDPPIGECIKRLLASPPKDHDTATTCCFVPITPTKNTRATAKDGPRYISPSKTYLGASATYGAIFDFVDFGAEANVFLFHCGAKNEPTKLEVAQMLCNEPSRLLDLLSSVDKYLELLKSLAEAASELVASNKGDATDLEEELEAPIKQYRLASANQITVVDDIISYRLFKEHLSCAPEDDALENFYIKLGAQKLSSMVREDVRVGNRMLKHELAEPLRKHVIERSKIFLYEYVNYRRDAIKHDSKWLEKHLRVEIVRTVSLRRTLHGQHRSHTEKRSAAGANEGLSWILYVAEGGPPDMYQVGQAVCQMLLDRPNQQAYLFFEPFLNLDLYGLRARGYNVDRILRAKAAEARIAEEQRLQALEEEQERIQEREKSWSQGGAEAIEATARAEPPTMPGGWGPHDESPGGSSNSESKNGESKKTGNIISRLGRRLGFDSGISNGQKSDAQQQLEEFVDAPTTQKHTTQMHAESDDGPLRHPAGMQQDLLNAVRACQPHGSSSLVNVATTSEVKEQQAYCDSTPATNLALVAEAFNGIRVYLSKTLSEDMRSQFLADNHEAITLFASVLIEIGAIYALSPQVVHIFHDPQSRVIAFNYNGSIFCNVRFFLHLHAAQLKASPFGTPRVEAGTWWWVVFAHELSHNLVKVHNSQHSYYTESFIQEYMGKMMAKASQWVRQGPAPPYQATE
ncbi:hypothetical protein CDD82_2646 [Ophiocordyceps australis]|uniref:Sacsin/Nov domain-containing protein n=1 Tax=Ophiocordyceps australis TaxID=1399860 RepID=A0A2C5ZWD1_9HYPO|nr:hypothetical protein CDD82_2646 [Ophiocordyceps australis]